MVRSDDFRATLVRPSRGVLAVAGSIPFGDVRGGLKSWSVTSPRCSKKGFHALTKADVGG